MSENAALTEDSNMPPLDAPAPEVVVEASTEAPATPEPVETPAEPKEDGVQKRINKITADKYTELRRADSEKKRADDAERQLREMQVQKPQEATGKPRLEDFDYDDAAFNAASIKYEVGQATQTIIKQQEATQLAQTQETERLRQTKVQQTFNERADKFKEKATDYVEAMGRIPDLPLDVRNAVLEAENGPELAYYLSQHLDVADQMITGSLSSALMQLGTISATLSTTNPNTKTSAAPDPITPITSGSSLANKDHSEMSMEEIYNS